MKSHKQKVVEAQQRAALRATLSTAQKYQAAYDINPDCREAARLHAKLIQEEKDKLAALNKQKLTGKVVIPSTKCEARKK